MRNVVVYAARLAQQLSERLPARIGGWVQGFMERVLRSERDRGEEARRRGPAGAVAAALAWAFRGAVAALASFLLGGSVRIPCKACCGVLGLVFRAWIALSGSRSHSASPPHPTPPRS